jgi:hypothetical protein
MSNLYTINTTFYGTILLKERPDLSSITGHMSLEVLHVERNADPNAVRVGTILSYDLSLITPFSYETVTIPLIL